MRESRKLSSVANNAESCVCRGKLQVTGWMMQGGVLLHVLVYTWAVHAVTVAAQGALCPQPKAASATFSMASRRNNTGHWITEVYLDRVGDDLSSAEHRESGAWKFDLSFQRTRCGPTETLRTTATITAPPPRAGPGYELYRGLGYYRFHPEGKTFAEAAAVCAAEGAHLAVINSERESDVIKGMFARHPKAGAWAFVGFQDVVDEGQYITIFGEPLSATGFTRWAASQPDNAGGNPGEDCGSVHRNSGLNDLPCTMKAAFVCEQEL